MFKKIYIFLISLSALFLGCNKESSEFTDWPIIESYLKPGDYFNLKITRQIPFSSDVEYSSDDINALSINAMYNGIVHPLTPLDSGLYVDSTLIIEEGGQYQISFTFNKKNVTAYTKIPDSPHNFTQSVTGTSGSQMDSTSIPPASISMPDPVKLTWKNTDGSYYLVVIENIEPTLTPIRDFGDKTPPGNRFRKAPVASSGLEINSMEFQYFGTHRLILFHVLPDYAALYEQNSASSQNLTNPSTSIINGYGIFTGLNSDTLYIEVNKE